MAYNFSRQSGFLSYKTAKMLVLDHLAYLIWCYFCVRRSIYYKMHLLFFQKDVDNFGDRVQDMLILKLFGVGGAVPP